MRTRPEALDDPVWQATYLDQSKTLWFALTDERAATIFNATHKVEEILPPEDGDYARAHWRGEQTPSVRLYRDDNSWVDYGAHPPKGNGRRDGGDSLELHCRVHCLSRADALSAFVTRLVRRAKRELEDAARTGRGPARWVATITTTAGWKRYDAIRKQSG